MVILPTKGCKTADTKITEEVGRQHKILCQHQRAQQLRQAAVQLLAAPAVSDLEPQAALLAQIAKSNRLL